MSEKKISQFEDLNYDSDSGGGVSIIRRRLNCNHKRNNHQGIALETWLAEALQIKVALHLFEV
jgi:hypothetical protein